MEKHHVEALRIILRMYGSYKVVKELCSQVSESVNNEYANNPDAVIHKDFKSIEKCVSEMKGSHFLRNV